METNLFTNNNNSSGSSSDAVKSQNNATQDMFTKLLVAQIKNQDPLAPTDPSQFVNQLTQQAQTEAIQNMAALTSSNASVLQSMQVLALGAQVGSEVTVNSPTVQLDSSKVNGSIALTANSSKTTVTLKSSDDKEYKIELGAKSAGTVPFTIDPVALGLPAGTYTMDVTTSNAEKPTVDIAGKLNSVRLSSTGTMILSVANLGEVSPGAITGFNGKTS
ncbi:MULTISPECIES: flagellar hook capping FlgD N-terminal domain-containing protein [unclassified Janthinobacterium]|uniref:flagellar hook capping FlgD N-terminal domain-containing protein n=1 Tax=unclassified Janthinobacterium TaxID=2610881 RepID=UPI00161EE7BF|nr:MULTISPECIES: flagellar hook capping FlgD N-terminal domain-containing protein [unclassified Janthinobacterium]MBB5366646.1 flagellar basal-body rod modification protein FlgD [Janthinobacterium sp. K2C7]MBB5380876.1 flagellar basal-body rod modification protein FlgD [Janthinobacterium sp. K2Li3]MBB5385028.1 flagellar basal-body rod modification protein FlgD [Janthinobacterium sp. K2E3]